jgi:preprotein translocase subunit SecA
MLTRTLEMVQSKVEAYYFDIRKALVDYDDVVNKHREVIYAERAKVLEGADLRENIEQFLESEVESLVSAHLRGDAESWNVEGFLLELATVFPLPAEINVEFVSNNTADDIRDAVLAAVGDLYDQREEQFTSPVMRALERAVMLQTIDRWWVQHLTAMSNLRQGIGLQAVGQRDPLVAYKTEGHQQFQALLERIQHDIVHTIFHVAPMTQAQIAQQQQRAQQAQQAAMPKGATAKREDAPAPRVSGVQTENVSTVMSKATANTSGDATSNEPRWMRRRQARAKSKGR